MVYFMENPMENPLENPISTWMRTGIIPSFGNLRLRLAQVSESGQHQLGLSIYLGLLRSDAQVHSSGRGLAVLFRMLATANGRSS